VIAKRVNWFFDDLGTPEDISKIPSQFSGANSKFATRQAIVM
jgi:hypothetical protein